MIAQIKTICRGDAAEIEAWLRRPRWSPAWCCLIIAAGSGIYGFTLGLWRAPMQATYTALKFPLLIFLTCAGNAVLNGILAQLQGARLSFRQVSFAILISFAIASVILGCLSPITLFVLYNAPPLDSPTAVTGHSIMLLVQVFLIAYAGIISNQRLFGLLEKLTGDRTTARRVLLSWLAGNLLLGSQLAWILRPFIGSPRLVVEFFRPDPLRGNFFEAVLHALRHLLS